jgi:hypothetical protein
MFKLYKINDFANESYYSTEDLDIGFTTEVELKESSSYSVVTTQRFNYLMGEYCEYHEDGIGFDANSRWEVKDGYACVIECIDHENTVYSVIEYFYSERDSSCGLVYDLPYWLHFIKLGE